MPELYPEPPSDLAVSIRRESRLSLNGYPFFHSPRTDVCSPLLDLGTCGRTATTRNFS